MSQLIFMDLLLTVLIYYNDYNNNINTITCDYDNSEEDNNNNVDRYDVGIGQDDDLVAKDYEENNYTTSSVPCVQSSSGITSIVDDCDPFRINNHYIIRCDNTDDTSPTITSIPVLFVPSSLEPASLSKNPSRLSSNCGLACLGYVPVALVASLATTFSLSSALLSYTFSFLSFLDYSFVLYWFSSNAYVFDNIGSSFNPNDVSALVNLHSLYLILSLESSHLLCWYIASLKKACNVEEMQSLKSSSSPNPISLLTLAFKIYCDFNPISLVLMIILMIMGLG